MGSYFLNIRQITSEPLFEVADIQIWGFGGEDARKAQKQAKENEDRQVARSRKVNIAQAVSGGSGWEDGADRYILDLAGVTCKYCPLSCCTPAFSLSLAGSAQHIRKDNQVVEEDESSDGVIMM